MDKTQKLDAKQRHNLKKFVKDLEGYRGRHTELVTVYIPAGYDINKVNTQLAQEQGTATNIKSTSTRKNVTDALEKMVQHLKIFKQTPPHGLAAFSGNVAEREGQSDVRVWSIEPPVPLNLRVYRCDKEFVLEPLKSLLESKEVYGLVVLDRRDAMIALLKGKTIIPLTQTHSHVPGKTRAGGQCLSYDTHVQLADGSLLTMDKLHNPLIVKSAQFKNFTLDDSRITGVIKSKKKIYKIITKYPRLEIQSSKDHVFFVASDQGIIEKASEELQVGDHLIMPEKINVKGVRQKINALQYYNGFILNKQGQEFMKKRRQEKNLDQKVLAKKIGLTQTAISVTELGKRNLRRDTLQKICKALDIPFHDFLEKYTQPSLYRNIKLPEVLNKDFAQFLGYYLGDGSLEKDRITFFEQEKEVALKYKKKYDHFFKIYSTYAFRESKNYHQIRFTSRPLVSLIQEEFPELKKAVNSEIPKKILLSPNKILGAFLKGFFDADGYVNLERGIGLGINNKKLAQQIQLALLRFSVISSLQEYDNRRNPYSDNPRFTVCITEKKSLQFFKRDINFDAPQKIRKLEQVINEKSNVTKTRQLIVPGSIIRQVIEKAGYNMQDFPKVTNFFRNERMIGKETFKSSILGYIQDKKSYNKLKEFHDYPFIPVKIESIEKTGRTTPMMDISVKNQNFIANGVFVHNSSVRFARLREGAKIEHYKKVADYMKEQFLPMAGLKGIIIGGPSTTTQDFLNKDYITGDLKKKIIEIGR